MACFWPCIELQERLKPVETRTKFAFRGGDGVREATQAGRCPRAEEFEPRIRLRLAPPRRVNTDEH